MKKIEYYKRGHPSRSLEAVMLGAMQIMELPLKGLQRGTKLTTGLETILRVFQQRMCLLSALKAKLKSNNFLGGGGFKTAYLSHGY